MAIKFDGPKGEIQVQEAAFTAMQEKATAFIFKRTYVGKKKFRSAQDIVKDKETAELLTKAIYAIVVLVMAGQAGSGAVDAVKDADWFSAAYKTLKTVAKSDEVKANAAPVLLKLIS